MSEQDGSNDSPQPESSGAPRVGVRSTRRARHASRPRAERASALTERVYASFTGLAIVTVFALDPEHATAQGVFLGLLAGIAGITLAGFVAELISHLILHAGRPSRSELVVMIRIALGAIASASIPLFALACAWLGLIGLETALRISIGIYLATLGLIAVLATRRTDLPLRSQLVALVGLLGLGTLAVLVLTLAH